MDINAIISSIKNVALKVEKMNNNAPEYICPVAKSPLDAWRGRGINQPLSPIIPITTLKEEVIYGPTGVIEEPPRPMRVTGMCGPCGPTGVDDAAERQRQRQEEALQYIATIKSIMPRDMTNGEFENLLVRGTERLRPNSPCPCGSKECNP